MWRPNSRLLLVALISLHAATYAAPPYTIAPMPMTLTTTATPSVSGFSPAGTCINKGSALTVQGSGFGTSSGKGIALGGNGIHVDLSVSSWGNTSIGVTIPNDSRIQGNTTYYIGVEKADHSQWLSNINRTIVICSGGATTSFPALSNQNIRTPPPAPGVRLGGTGVAPGGPGRGTPGGPSSDAPSSTDGSDSYYYDSSATTPFVPSNQGGSLLASQMPEPPQDVPPAPAKESTGIEPAELVVVSGSMAEAQQLAVQAQSLRLAPKRRNQLAGLGFVVTVFRVPKEISVGDALLALRRTSPHTWADANHRFQLLGDEVKTYGQKLIGWNGAGNCGTGTRVGMVDTAVDINHPRIRGRRVQQRDFLSTGSSSTNAEHGTATAGLLVGQEMGLIPSSQLFAANVFRAREKEVDTTAESVVLALNWLAESKVNVINLSLGGPRNLLIEAAVKRLIDMGIAVVAAAGNGGDGAAPVFPAAQPGVIAVTAVDAQLSPYKKANRGEYISFAAPGVDVWTAAPGKDGIYATGTSYAAPFVTAALVVARQTNSKVAWTPLLKQIQTKARDLGAPGKDSSFGWGLIQTSGCTVARKT